MARRKDKSQPWRVRAATARLIRERERRRRAGSTLRGAPNSKLRAHGDFLEQKCRGLFDLSPTPYFCLDAAGRIHEMNPAARALLGLQKRRVLGKELRSFVGERGRRAFQHLCRQAAEERVPGRCGVEWGAGSGDMVNVVGIPWPKGRGLWMAVIEPMGARQRKTQRAVQSRLERLVRDRTRQLDLANRMLHAEIAERIRAEGVLHREHRYLNLLHRIAGAANDAGSSRDITAAAVRELSVHMGWVVGQAYVRDARTGVLVSSGIWHLADRERFESFRAATEQLRQPDMLVERAAASQSLAWAADVTGVSGFLRKEAARAVGIQGGLALPVLVRDAAVSVLEFFSTAPMVEPDARRGELLGQIAGHVARVFEREGAERALRERERLAALGNIAAVFAHEVGNPLNSISTALQMLLRSREHGGEMAPVLKDAVTEVVRMGALLDDFRAFSRAPLLRPEPIHLPDIVDEVGRLEAPRCDCASIELRFDIDRDLPVVVADPRRLKQVLLNLCQNAIDAMPSGGVLTLKAHGARDRVVLEVEDTGVGIAPGVDVFEPFTTTKEKGTGLGLTVVQKIVAEHGGQVSYRSQPGKGTTFRVELPFARPAAEESVAEEHGTNEWPRRAIARERT